MVSEDFKTRTISSLICAGLIIAVLSVLEPHIESIAALCGFLGDGCKETEQFSILRIPVSFWGVIFYFALLMSVFFKRSWTFYLTVCGAGVELVLVKIMITQNFICFLCFMNLLILTLLFVSIIGKKTLWKALALSFLLFIIIDNSFYKANVLSKKPGVSHDNSSVIAVVGGNKIYTSDIVKPIAGQLSKLEKKIYKRKRNELDKLIEQTLLKIAAKEKKITPEGLIRQIVSKVEKISKVDVDNHYHQHKDFYDRQNDSKKTIRKKIQTYLQEKKLSEKIKDYVRPLNIKYGVSDYLTPPLMPIADINIANSPFFGPDDAPITIIEFSDYLCPSCRRAHKLTKEIKKLYPGKIKWVFKDYPLKRHKGAKRLAEAARCAGEQGKFWEYQDLLFTSKETLNDKTLIKYAESLGLNVNQFLEALNNKKHLSAIEQDINDALQSGISSTPTFIINDKLHSGSPTSDDFKKMIETELNY